MTFYPEIGTYSKEDFLSSEGATFTNAYLQGITGGYVTLLPTLSGSSSIIRTWNDIPNWSFTNNLYNLASVTGVFKVLSGDITSQVNTVSGDYGITTASNAWLVRTQYPAQVQGYGFSGQGSYGLMIGSGSPNQQLTQYFRDGGNAVTFEFDIAVQAAYSGVEPLAGFSATGNNLTGLPPLTGVIGHGILFTNGTYWDFLETTPYGIRSLNHPELAISTNLVNPTRVRFGIRNTDLYITTEDGKSLVGLNKFDTQVPNPTQNAFAVFGAPAKRFSTFMSGMLTNVDACVGESLWDNIKFLTGNMSIYQGTGSSRNYSTSTVSMYTAPFDPGISIRKFINANISYIPYNGGPTTVSSQYSGAAGWTTYNSVSITTGNIATLDLTSFPVFTYPRQDYGTDYSSNPIRFKIDQRSASGNALPPAVEAIEVFASRESIQLDILPDWKLATASVECNISIETGTFLTDDPAPEIWSTVLVNAPTNTGIYGSNSFSDEALSKTVSVLGTGEVVAEGPYRTAFKNYVITTGSAVSGSAAYSYFGLTPQYNMFPNPLFSEGFRSIGTGESRFVTGLTEGYLATNTEISRTYTGLFKVLYDQEAVYRPEAQAQVDRINSYLGRTSSPNEEYTQSVYVYPNASTHNGRVGLSAIVPQGIATGNLLVSFDIEMSKGSGINVNLSGLTTQNYIIPGEFIRSYKTISLFCNSDNRELAVSFNIPSGYNGDEYKYNIDNLVVSKIDTSYLYVTGLTGTLHYSGLADSYLVDETVYKPFNRASTIAYTSLFLDSYPSSLSGILLKLSSHDGKGLELNIDSNGYLNAYVDTADDSWAATGTGSTLYEKLGRSVITSTERVPIGSWCSIGFAHDVKNYRNFSHASITGALVAQNFASTNRCVLTINGYPVASSDMMSGWTSHRTNTYDSAPFSSYVDLTGNVSAVIASGLRCKVDGLHVLRPPVADVEAELSIKAARVTTPYFVPDSLFAAGNADENFLFRENLHHKIGKECSLISCYNFSGPGYTHWDRGPANNHLVYYGTISKEDSCPYSGQELNSTRFTAGSYGIANYSSSTEKVLNSADIVGLSGSAFYDELGHNDFNILGWIYPRTTGKFFLWAHQPNIARNRLELKINTGSYLIADVYDSSNTVTYSVTGHQAPTGCWTSFNFKYLQNNDYVGDFATNVTSQGFFYSGSTLTSNSSSITNGLGHMFYRGRTTTNPSSFRFGGEADINLFNWVIKVPSTGEVEITIPYESGVDKEGHYQWLLQDNNVVFTGDHSFDSYYNCTATMPPRTAGNRYYSVAAHNTYNNIPRLAGGMQIFDNKPYRDINNYYALYDTSVINQVYGSTDSVIRLGNQVPESAINIAWVSSPGLTVPSSIATLDLSDKNVNNLITYKDGTYNVGKPYVVTNSVLTGYNNINYGIYSGRIDLEIKGQVVSPDVNISTVSLVNKDLSTAYNAYYYYLVGRGTKAVKIDGAYPHYTGQINDTSTGTVPDNYIANLEKISNSVQLKNRKGESLSFDQYPYSVYYSPYSPDLLRSAIASGQNIYLNNIGSHLSGYILPDGAFSVILLTHYNKIDNDSVFIHYNSYDLASNSSAGSQKEIVNPQPIFRKRLENEPAGVGKFDIIANENGYFDLKVYGIESGYNGKL